jgi:molybdopterin-guanine dinucleotide biosynthesis protein A
MAMKRDPLAAAILVGGQSRRMGVPKATLRLTPDGPTVITSVITTLRHVTTDIMLVGSDDFASDDPDVPRIGDTMPDAGPLGGIHAALTASSREHVLVVACDMPFLNVDVLRFMAALPRDYDVLVPVVGQPQPLHAIYTISCLPAIEAYLAEGRRRVDGWFDHVRVRMIDEATVNRFDPERRTCFNMNTPSDLEWARDAIRRS